MKQAQSPRTGGKPHRTGSHSAVLKMVLGSPTWVLPVGSPPFSAKAATPPMLNGPSTRLFTADFEPLRSLLSNERKQI